MSASDSYQIVSIRLPGAARPWIDSWVEKSGLAFPEFCGSALTLGARIQLISLEPVLTLAAPLRKKAVKTAQNSVTPGLLVRLIAGEELDASAVGVNDWEDCVEVRISKKAISQLIDLAEKLHFDREKLVAYAFATGIQVLAGSLESGSAIPLDVLLQAVEREISPSELMQAWIKQKLKEKPDPPRV